MREGQVITDGSVKWVTKDIRKAELATTTKDGLMSKEDKALLDSIDDATHTISVVPYQYGALTYNGTVQTPTWMNYDENKMTIGGTSSGTNANTYTVTFTPASGYYWSDGTRLAKSVSWVIQEATVGIPAQVGTLTYDGNVKEAVFDTYDQLKMNRSGTYSATDAGTYTVKFTPLSNYKWTDGTKTEKSVTWSIGKAIIFAIPSQAGTLTYNLSPQTPSWNDFSPSQLDRGGVYQNQSNAGTYTATFTPNNNHTWADGTRDSKNVTWSIGRKSIVNTPSQKGELFYTGSAQTPQWDNWNEAELAIGGIYQNQIPRGTYNATFTPTANYKWSDSYDTSPKTVQWSIGYKVITNIPSQSNTLTWDGTAKSPTWTNYSDDELILSGRYENQIDAGEYTAIFTPRASYCWSDGTTAAKYVVWTINRERLTAIPAQSNTITYDGLEHSPEWSNYPTAKLLIDGVYENQVNGGTYVAIFTPKSNYAWPDGTTAAKQVNWTISPASATFSTEDTYFRLTASTPTAVTTITTNSDGNITVTPTVFPDEPVVDFTIDQTNRTITWEFLAEMNGMSFEVSVANTNNYNITTEPITVTIDCIAVSETLSENSPAVISAIAKSGNAADFWSVGDIVGPVSMTGKLSTGLTLNNYNAYFFIIGFNHNPERELPKSIHFMFGRSDGTSSSKDIAFVDNKYGSYNFTAAGYFRHHTTNTNSGGWAGSDLRKNNCVWFLEALPTEWQDIIVECPKWTDNTGGGSNTASYVTETSDKIWLLAEFEVFGSRTYANSAEKNYQARYAYYGAGNNTIKYRHDNINTALYGQQKGWWERSVYSPSSYSFMLRGDTYGAKDAIDCYYSYGFAPCFAVGEALE